MTSTELNTYTPFSPSSESVINVDIAARGAENAGLPNQNLPDLVVEPVSMDMAHMLGRPTFLAQYTLTDSNASVEIPDPFVTWFADQRVNTYLKPYGYLRGKFKILLDVTGTPFQYGAFRFFLRPLPVADLVSFGNVSRPRFLIDDVSHATQVPHVDIDLSAVGKYELTCPLVSNLGWLPISNPPFGNSYILAAGWVPLSPYQTTAPPFRPFNLNIYAWMEDVEVCVGVPLQSERTAEASTTAAGSIATMAMRQYQLFKSKYDTTFDLMSRVAPPVLSAMGFSKPLVTDQVGAVVARANTDFAATRASRFFGYKSGTDPLGGLAVNPALVGLGSEEDTKIINIAQRWGYVGRYLWEGTTNRTGPLARIMVTPVLATQPGSTNLTVPTPLAFAAAPFMWWGGGIEYKITVWASPFHKGTLRIVHVPGSTTVSSSSFNANLSRVPSKILDVCGKTETTFCADWKKPVPFISVNTPAAVAPMTPNLIQTFIPSTSTTYVDTVMNGQLQIFVEAPLVSSNSTVPPVYIVVECRACPDFRVARPYITNVNSYKATFDNTAPAVLPADAEDEPLEMQSERVPYLVSVGEAIEDVKELAKVMTPAMTVSCTAGSLAANFFGAYEFLVPAYPPIPSNASQTPFQIVVASNCSATMTGYTYASWFEQAFLAQRGGYRAALQVHNTNSFKSWVSAGLGWAASGFGYSAWDLATATGTPSQGYALFEGVNSDLTTPLSNASHGAYEVELPSINPTFFRNAFGGAFFKPTTQANRRGPVLGMRVSAFTGTANTVAALALAPTTIWMGAADDYSLSGFNFVPPLGLAN
jgi:hypothetical protein